VHITASIFTLLVLVLKLALHSSWIASAVRGAFTHQAPQPARLAAAPARAAGRPVSRREFLEVMGVAGAASLLALIQGADRLEALSGGGAQAASQDASQASSGTASTSSNRHLAALRQQRRSRHLQPCRAAWDVPPRSLPKICDSDNNLLDLGECVIFV
jgi:hypothetical protein